MSDLRSEVRLVFHLLRDGAEVPDEAEPRKSLEAHVGGVELPPAEALAGGVGVAVMIIMPAFSEGDDGEERGVAAVVFRVVAPFSPDVSEGVDEKGAVKKDRGGDEKGPDEELSHGDAEGGREGFEGGSDGEHDEAVDERDDLVEAVEEDELGEFFEVGDVLVGGGEILHRGEPSDVGPGEAVDDG